MTILAQDTYTRPNSAPWGLASDGIHTWVLVNDYNSGDNSTIVSNAGQINGFGGFYLLGNGTQGDTESFTETPVVNQPGDNFGLLLRSNADTSNCYILQTDQSTNRILIFRSNSFAFTMIAGWNIVYTSGTVYKMRFRVTGNSTPLLQAKIWASTDTESSSWLLSALDISGSAITSAGQYGLYGEEDFTTGNLKFTSFIVTDVPAPGGSTSSLASVGNSRFGRIA